MARRRKQKQAPRPGAVVAKTTTANTVLEAIPAPVVPPAPQIVLEWLTLERALYALLLLVAAGLRLGDLGRWPLQGTEAGTALDAWRFLQGTGNNVVGHSPLLFHGNVLTFALFSSGDAQARLVPALFGTLLVGLPYLLRSVLGRSGALMTALFLAISPTLLYFSRQDTPAVVAATCAIALLAALTHFTETGDRRALSLGAGALGLGFTAGPSFYMYLFLWGLFVLAAAAIRRRQPDAWIDVNLPDREALAGPLLVAAATFGLVTTAFLLDWTGLQAAVSLAGAWLLGLWHLPTPLFTWAGYLSLLALYEPAVALFGLAGAFLFAREERWTVAFAAAWFAGAWLIYSLFGGAVSPSRLVVMILPLTFLAGATTGRLLEDLALYGTWETEAVYLALSTPIVLFLILVMASYANSGVDRYLTLATIGLFALAITLAVMGNKSGVSGPARAAGLVLLVFLSLGQVRGAWNLALERADNPAEPMIIEATSPDIRNLPATIANLSNERLQQRDAIAVAYQSSLGNLVGWYLRDFRDVQLFSQYNVDRLPPVVIVPHTSQPPALGKDYIGQRFHLQRRWRMPELRGPERVRWFLYRDVTTGYTDMDAILYVQVPR